jgi:transposase InsO family protein
MSDEKLLRIHPQLTERARKFRRPLTPMETRLWHRSRNRGCYGYKFRRQVERGSEPLTLQEQADLLGLSRACLSSTPRPPSAQEVAIKHRIDITYIRCKGTWMYLVAILDGYSRYMVAWELDQTLEVAFVLACLEAALGRATPAICTSDQGSHFTSEQFVQRLLDKAACRYCAISCAVPATTRCSNNCNMFSLSSPRYIVFNPRRWSFLT